jgi:hypothetical protein
MRDAWVGVTLAIVSIGPAAAANSYVLPDGLSRASAVALHCVTGPGTASACGTSMLPMVIVPASGAVMLAVPVGGQPASRSTSISPTSATLFPANPSRRYLAFQAPQASFIWVNFLGGTAAPNAHDCIYFAAGSFYESGQYVDQGSITIFSPVSATISAWEG